MAGNAAGAPALAGASTTTSWHFLRGVSVWTGRAGAIVTLGVVNAGIGGNRLLNPGNATIGGFQGIIPLFGQAALTRFDRDVLTQPGVEAVIGLLGVNDLGQPVSISPASEEVTEPALLQRGRRWRPRNRLPLRWGERPTKKRPKQKSGPHGAASQACEAARFRT
ncbi:MAG: SGNH/GDSL hydrolase family protein, partial [Massilia sp.]